ncbi:probable ATP-dependent RNA helicase DHX37 isoform X2 [Mercenaria mercenaria]|uniref:probable ATP-dependent RNA helicase DHX37 isoform X2 n=1 Tax=Mercenaria mercenaria TaxID=6596 RepID=UPI00234F0BAA|nr:probable ATP-dependent RNA helicase DHX37 isoform X2 [Mercenaria mercenaria]
MGKNKKGFNWKARLQPETVVDRSSEKDVKVDIEGLQSEKGFDESNVLALPSQKRESEITQQHTKLPKKLTKKERRKLEKVLEQKEKKAKRADVLESLAAHQASQDEMNQFVGIAEMQTGKLKRKHEQAQNDVRVNTIAGSNKKRRKMISEQEEASDSESIHTSDMSTDEEDSGVISDERDEKYSGEITDVKKDNEGLTDKNSCDNCEKNRDINSPGVANDKHKTGKVTDESERSVVNNAGNSVGKVVFVKTKHHVRGTSGNWTVCELRTASEKEQNITENIKSKGDENSVNNKGVIKDTEDSSKQKDALSKSEESEVRKVVNIPVIRDKEIQDGRLKLPILGEEQVIMESINENPVVIICGETGSGKTTQVPQFLYEAGYAHGGGIIAVTEPRRVAAISMSSRVATEMSLSNREVSYQIRYEGNVTPDTKIKFMTDGVLLKEVQQDFLLTKYSVVIIDEAHERSVYTDILIGLLSRIVPLRHKRGNPLKLVIMSATLRVEDFTENNRLFRVKPPVVKVDARQFPVTIHYNKRTPLENYLNEAYRKTCKIHKMLPEGGILVFVTGQQEVHTLCRKLKQTFPLDKNNPGAVTSLHQKRRHKHSEKNKEPEKVELPKINLDNYSVSPLDEEAEREGGSDLDLSDDDNDLGNQGDVEDDDLGIENVHVTECSQPLYVLPLYSLLSTQKQRKVFGPVPEGCRLCVVATNVAETSLTIPGIKYVVDTGKSKTKFYDKVTGVSTFRITWTSKASANQRAGRAGRVGPGHCYRLFSSAVFNDEFEKFSPAEITRRPVDDLVLQMKDMNIEKVVNFPYPTPPDKEQIHAAERLLISLGALTKPVDPKSFRDSNKEPATTITPLGRAMACFPVSPRYSKMLAMGHQQNLLPYVVVIVSALSVQELFMEVYSNPQDESQEEQFKQRLIHLTEVKRRWAGAGHSLLLGDLMVMLKAVGSSEYEGGSASFCEAHGLRHKAMREVRKLRAQLTNSVNTVIPDASICVDPKMSPPDDTQAKLLRQIVLSGMGDHVARKLPELPATNPDAKKLKNAYQCPNLEDPVFLHPTSVLYRERPEFVVYQHIEETSKLYMKGITAIEPEWLS